MESAAGDLGESGAVTVVTSVEISADTTAVWRVLCDATLPLTAPCWFRLGVPTPEKCVIVSKTGGVGGKRQCTTNRGVIHQRITAWDEHRRLAFEWVEDTLGLDRYLQRMCDTFTLEPLRSAQILLVRQTEYVPRASVGWLRRALLRLTVKRIHRFVMRNFKVISEDHN